MAKAELKTQLDVFKLPAPTKGERMFADQSKRQVRAPGLSLRVRESGSRTWVFCYRWGGLPRRFTIGDASNDPKGWTLARAQAEAIELRRMVNKSENPADKRKADKDAQAKKPTEFSAVGDDYLKAKASGKKPLRSRSLAESKRHLEDYWKPLNKLALASIDRATVASHLGKIAAERGPAAANRGRSTLSALFAWAISEGLCNENPTVGTKKKAENEPRERTLSDAEAAAVWLAASEDDYGRIVRLLLLTGCRRDEIGGLRWQEIDLEGRLISLPAERTKNDTPHDVPLCDVAVALLQAIPRRVGRDLVFGNGKGEGGFSGWSHSKKDFDKAAKLGEPWRLHDLRRTVRTGLGELGVLPHVAEAVINHLPPKLVRTYDRADYLPEKRAALEKWATHLAVEIAKVSGANVTRLSAPKLRGQSKPAAG